MRFNGLRMKAYALGAVILSCGLVAPLFAQTLEKALSSAYRTNPALLAARDALEVTNEEVPQALSGFRPTLTATASKGLQRREQRTSAQAIKKKTVQKTRPLSARLNINQPLYRGGRTQALLAKAERRVEAKRARLRVTEQAIFQQTVTAYSDVWRDEAVLRLNRGNERVLMRQLDAVRDRFQVGELTRTDLALAESRLAQAVAVRIKAEGDLKSSVARYERLSGLTYEGVEQPLPFSQLPQSLDDLIAEAQRNNPDLVAARRAEDAARDQMRAIEGEFYPTVALKGSLSYDDEQSTRTTRSTSGLVMAEVTVPLYQQGQVSSRARAASHQARQRLRERREKERAVQQSAISSWERLVSTRARLRALDAVVSSAKIALEGIRQEEEVGQRTVLDVLNAEQELLDANVNLVRVQRDEVVATYNILAASGQLDAGFIGLDVVRYDPVERYRAVRGLWFGGGE